MPVVDSIIKGFNTAIRSVAVFAAGTLAVLLVLSILWAILGMFPAGREVQKIARPVWQRGVAVIQWIAPADTGGSGGSVASAPSVSGGSSEPVTALGLAQQVETDKTRRDQAQKALDARRLEAAAQKQVENQKINLILGNAEPGDTLVVGVFDRATKKPVTGQVRLFLRDESTTEEVVLKPGEAKVKPAVKGRSYTLWAQSLDSMAQSNVCTIEYQGPGAQHQDLWMGPDFGGGGPPTTP